MEGNLNVGVACPSFAGLSQSDHSSTCNGEITNIQQTYAVIIHAVLLIIMTIDFVGSDYEAVDNNTSTDDIVIVFGAIALTATAASFILATYKWFIYAFYYLTAARYKSEFQQQQRRCWPTVTALMTRLNFHLPLIIMLNALVGALYQILRLTTRMRGGDDALMNVLLFLYHTTFISAHTISCRMAARVNVRIRYGSMNNAHAIRHLSALQRRALALNIFTAAVWTIPFIIQANDSAAPTFTHVTVSVLMLLGSCPFWIDVSLLAMELRQFEGLVAVSPSQGDTELTPNHKSANANANLTPTTAAHLNGHQIKERELQGKQAHSGWINSSRSALAHSLITLSLALAWIIVQWPYAVSYWLFISQTFFAVTNVRRLQIIVVNTHKHNAIEQTPTVGGRQIAKTTSASPPTANGRTIADQDLTIAMPQRTSSLT